MLGDVPASINDFQVIGCTTDLLLLKSLFICVMKPTLHEQSMHKVQLLYIYTLVTAIAY